MIDFDFPTIGDTGKGEPVFPPGTSKDDWSYWERPTYWAGDGKYWVTYQLDRPAIAFRCHYPGGSAPCDQATADRFIEWAKEECQK